MDFPKKVTEAECTIRSFLHKLSPDQHDELVFIWDFGMELKIVADSKIKSGYNPKK